MRERKRIGEKQPPGELDKISDKLEDIEKKVRDFFQPIEEADKDDDQEEYDDE